MKLHQLKEAQLANRWIPSNTTNYWFTDSDLDSKNPADIEYWNWIRDNEKDLETIYHVLESIWYREIDNTGMMHGDQGLGFRDELEEYYHSNPPSPLKKLDSEFLNRSLDDMWEVLDQH